VQSVITWLVQYWESMSLITDYPEDDIFHVISELQDRVSMVGI